VTADNESPTCLFFDANGNGPSELRIIKREIREVVEGGETVVPRAFGLCWEVTGPLHFVEDGGLMLDTEVATWLRDKLTAWLDAPRLAARETAEVVAEVEGFRLLRTTAGEWAVRWPCDDDDEIDWDTEVVARQNFKDITGIDTTGGGQ
jgi:hypothetical protein